MSSRKRLLIKTVIPILILALAGGTLKYFYDNKPEARTRKRPFLGTLVQVLELKPESKQIQIKANGVVHAEERIILTSRTTGVTHQFSSKFVEGGFFRKGEVLLKINPTIEANSYYTNLTAPFNGVVQSVDVSEGQFVTPGFQMGTVIGTDTAQIRVDLPLQDIARLTNSRSSQKLDIPATVQLDYGSHIEKWEGVVRRNLMELSSKGMMAQLMIQVDDPFRVQSNQDTSEPGLPLFIGAFVDVGIPAKVYDNVFIIPSQALHDNNTVYLVKDGSLEIRPVTASYRFKDDVFVEEGLKAGEQLVVSPLKGAAQGLKVRIEGQEPVQRRGKGKKGEGEFKGKGTFAEKENGKDKKRGKRKEGEQGKTEGSKKKKSEQQNS